MSSTSALDVRELVEVMSTEGGFYLQRGFPPRRRVDIPPLTTRRLHLSSQWRNVINVIGFVFITNQQASLLFFQVVPLPLVWGSHRT
jgi:hypothetical protein